MKKSFLLPLVAVVVAAGGAFATTGFGAQAEAYGRNALGQCQQGMLVEPENCSLTASDQQCKVNINGNQVDAWADAECETEIFRQPENN